MTKRAKPVRAWAVRKPRGGLLICTTRTTRAAARVAFNLMFSSWPLAEKAGYRVSRVTVAEDK